MSLLTKHGDSLRSHENNHRTEDCRENNQDFKFEGQDCCCQCSVKPLRPWFLVIGYLKIKYFHKNPLIEKPLQLLGHEARTLTLNDTWEATSPGCDINMHRVPEGPHVQRMGLHPGQVCAVQLPD